MRNRTPILTNTLPPLPCLQGNYLSIYETLCRRSKKAKRPDRLPSQLGELERLVNPADHVPKDRAPDHRPPEDQPWKDDCPSGTTLLIEKAQSNDNGGYGYNNIPPHTCFIDTTAARNKAGGYNFQNQTK